MLDKLKLWFKNDIIEFYCHPNYAGVIPEPVQASKKIPDWWKKLPHRHDGGRDAFGDKPMTAKKCMPLQDVMSLGYIIPLQGDLQVITNSDRSIIKVTNPTNMKLAEFHDQKQIGGKQSPGYPTDPIKFINYWVIKTAPGWSSLFVPPINHLNPHFTCLGGLVDTDRYPKEVNFPALWHTPNFDDKLPAGTPLVQVIPIKRNSFPKQPKVRDMTDEEFKEIDRISRTQQSRISYYTKELREPRS